MHRLQPYDTIYSFFIDAIVTSLLNEITASNFFALFEAEHPPFNTFELATLMSFSIKIQSKIIVVGVLNVGEGVFEIVFHTKRWLGQLIGPNSTPHMCCLSLTLGWMHSLVSHALGVP